MFARIENTITENDQSIGNSQDFEPIGLSKIKDLVRRFRVCWKVYPEQALINVVDSKQAHVNRELRKIGLMRRRTIWFTRKGLGCIRMLIWAVKTEILVKKEPSLSLCKATGEGVL